VILLDGNIYGHSDTKGWICQDMMSGDVKWADKSLPSKGTIAYADGHFYCRSDRGPIALIEATPTAWKESGRIDRQPERSDKQAWPHLVIANGKLYVRDMDWLLCYDVKAK
jgi:outer membrane protein assembly factor BamB